MTKDLHKVKQRFQFVDNTFIIVFGIFMVAMGLEIAPEIGQRGYEIPKVMMFMDFSFIYALGISIYLLIRDGFQFKRYLYLFFLFLVFSIGTLITFIFEDYNYELLSGSFYRAQGLFFYLQLIWLFFSLYFLINLKNLWVLVVFWLTSAYIQATLGIAQFIESKNSLDNIFNLEIIRGNLLQSNIYSGHVLVGAIIFFNLIFTSKYKYTIPINLIGFLVTSIAIIISGSIWSIICLIFGCLLSCLFWQDQFNFKPNKLLFAIFLLFLPSASIFVSIFEIFQVRLDYVSAISQTMINRAVDSNIDLFRLFFGYGFDNLGQTLFESGYFPGRNVDRAHNIVFDLLFTIGLFGLCTILFFIYKFFNFEFSKLKDTNLLEYGILPLLIVLILRSLVHTNSVVNLIDLVLSIVLLMKIKESLDTK